MTDVKVVCEDARHGQLVLGLLRLPTRSPLSADDLSTKLEQAVGLLQIEAQLLGKEFDETEALRRAKDAVRQAELHETQLTYIPYSSRLSRNGSWRTTVRPDIWADRTDSGQRVWHLGCSRCRRALRKPDGLMLSIVARHAESGSPLDISTLRS